MPEANASGNGGGLASGDKGKTIDGNRRQTTGAATSGGAGSARPWQQHSPATAQKSKNLVKAIESTRIRTADRDETQDDEGAPPAKRPRREDPRSISSPTTREGENDSLRDGPLELYVDSNGITRAHTIDENEDIEWAFEQCRAVPGMERCLLPTFLILHHSTRHMVTTMSITTTTATMPHPTSLSRSHPCSRLPRGRLRWLAVSRTFLEMKPTQSSCSGRTTSLSHPSLRFVLRRLCCWCTGTASSDSEYGE
jgi:hypothetical protein